MGAEEEAGRLHVASTVIPLPRKRRQRDAERPRVAVVLQLRIDDAGIKEHPEMLARELPRKEGHEGDVSSKLQLEIRRLRQVSS